MNDIEKAILELIEKRYKKKYIGGIKVTKLTNNRTGYKLSLDLGNPDKGSIIIAAELDNVDDFLKFVDKELISRQLIKVQWFKGVKTYFEDETGGTYCKNE